MASKSIKPCPVMEGNTTCGETETLAIINEFKTLYERKMHKIDSEAGGDNLPVLQAKIHLQKQWIRDLTAQNELLVRAVEELEKEATEKVIMLEGKLHGRGMEGTHNLAYLQNDLNSLIEFIRRIREEDNWAINGLQFYNVTYEDLFGSSLCLGCNPPCEGDKVENKFRVTFEITENLDTLCPINADNLTVDFPKDGSRTTFNLRYCKDK